MGVDVYSESGVLATTEEMVSFITGKNKKDVIQICQEFYDNLKHESDQEPDSEWRIERYQFFEALNSIQAKTIADLREVVSGVVRVSGKPGKYDLDTHVLHSDDLLSLFSHIVSSYEQSHDIALPELNSVEAWGSARYNGWEVPLGEACFVFDKNDCFEQRMSESGQLLKKVIGHCDVTDWTVYSC